MKHKDLIDFYFSHPWEIEEGFRPIFKEFGIGHGRVDIIGVDKDRNLCLVEVKTRRSIQDENQVRHYRSSFHNLFRILGLNTAIRAIIVAPEQVKDLGKTKTIFGMEGVKIKRINDIPTSHELYGLKPERLS